MKCNNFKTRTKTIKKKRTIYNYCTKLKKEIPYSKCQECIYKEYKQYKPIKKRTYKQAKREKERYSIIYPNLNKCAECSSMYNIEKNEVFGGAYRGRSIKYGMIVPLCHNCHEIFHNDYELNLKYKFMFQKKFMENHTRDEFIEIFKQDYIYKLKNKKTRI